MAVKLNPYYVEARYNLAVVLEKMGRSSQALTHYLKFIELASREHKQLVERVKEHIEY